MGNNLDAFASLSGGDEFQSHLKRKLRREGRRQAKAEFKNPKYKKTPNPGPDASVDGIGEARPDAAHAWEIIDETALSPYATSLLSRLKEAGIFAKSRSLDQHFLADDGAIRTLAESATIGEGDSVLEIGPGPGNLTEAIWEVCRATRASLSTIEIDPVFHPLLEKLPASGQIDMRWGDALVEMPTVVRQRGINKVVANIPYSILEPLLRTIHSSRTVHMAVLLVGKSYAERAVADFRDEDPVGERFSVTSLFSQARFSPEIIKEIPRESFLPPPRTESAIVRLNPRRGRNIDFLTIADALIKRPMMQVRSLLQHLLVQQFDTRRLSQIKSLDDARTFDADAPLDIDKLGFPSELLRSPIHQLTNEQLQRIMLKSDLQRKRGKLRGADAEDNHQ